MPKASDNQRTYTYEELTSIHLNSYRAMGLIPYKNQTYNYIKTRIYSVTLYSLNLTFFLLYVSSGLRMMIMKNFEFDYIIEQLICHILVANFAVLHINRQKFFKLMVMCEKLWLSLTPSESKIIKRYEQKTVYFRNFYLINGIFATLSYSAYAYADNITGKSINGTRLRKLPYLMYAEFMPYQREPYYSFMILFQSILVFVGGIIFTLLQTIGPFIIMFSCGYFKIIQTRLESEIILKNSNKIDGYKTNLLTIKRLKTIVNFHQDTLTFCTYIENFLRYYNLVTITHTVFLLSSIGLRVMKNNGDTLKYFCAFTANFLLFVSIQWSPEYLLQESEGVARKAYSVYYNTEHYNKEIYCTLMMMMLRAQKPVQLTAGGYVNLSLYTCGSLLRSALSTFTVLRQFIS